MDINKLTKTLEDLPALIRTQALAVLELEKQLKEAKLEYDIAYGTAITSVKAPNATEKKSQAIILSKEEAKKVLEAEYNLKKGECELNYLTNRFVAVRKIGSIEQEMMRSQLSGN